MDLIPKELLDESVARQIENERVYGPSSEFSKQERCLMVYSSYRGMMSQREALDTTKRIYPKEAMLLEDYLREVS